MHTESDIGNELLWDDDIIGVTGRDNTKYEQNIDANDNIENGNEENDIVPIDPEENVPRRNPERVRNRPQYLRDDMERCNILR